MTAGMMKKMGWQVYEEVNQDKTGEADGMDQEVGSKTRWCTSKSAICDFKRDEWWARIGDNRQGAGTARRLKTDEVVKIARLSSCKNFVNEREKFIFDAFVDL